MASFEGSSTSDPPVGLIVHLTPLLITGEIILIDSGPPRDPSKLKRSASEETSPLEQEIGLRKERLEALHLLSS